jgi:hypothetical protein
MSNSIKNMIQQSKIEPSLQSALSNADLHNIEMKRRASVTSFTSNFSAAANRKKSSETAGSPATSNYRSSLINAAVAAVSSSNAPSSAVDSGSSTPGSPSTVARHPHGVVTPTTAHASSQSTNLNEVKISPSGEIREEARRASVKLQQQQIQQLQSMLEAGHQKLDNMTIGSENSTVKNIPDYADDDDDDFVEEENEDQEIVNYPGIPPLPPPLSTPSSEDNQILSRQNMDFDIKIIDETSGDNEDDTGSNSSVSLRERL